MLLLFDGDLGAVDTLRFVEDKIGVGWWMLDLKSGAMRWSSGLYRLLGCEPNAMEASIAVFRGMIHPDDKLARDDLDRLEREAVSIDREFRIIRRDGRILWVVNRGEIIMNAAGRAERAIGLIIDISNKQNALLELRANDERYRQLTRAVSTAIWTAPPNGLMTDFPAWRELTGQSLDELQGLGWLNAVHPDDRAGVAEMRARSIALGTPYSATYRIRLKDGSYRWFNSRAAPVHAADGELKEWIGVLIDVFQDASPTDGTIWLTGAQARAARAILNWTVKDVAEAAGVSISTIRRLEENDGRSSLRSEIVKAVKTALERAGVEFISLPAGAPAVRPSRHSLPSEPKLRVIGVN
jgi:PAS domain S-box-containing protein